MIETATTRAGHGADDTLRDRSVDELLAACDTREIRLTVREGRLHASAPLGAVTDEILDALRSRQRELVRAVWARHATERLLVKRTPDDVHTPLAVPQERLWFLQQLDPGSVAYNIAVSLRLTGHLDVNALVTALETLVARHDALRTIFPLVDGRPVQQVLDGIANPLERLDLTGLPVEERESEIARRAAQIANRPFDLQQPLVRAELLHVGEDEHVLTVVIHHLVADQWTMGLLGQELGQIYRAARLGRPHALPALPVRYRDFAICHRAWLMGRVAQTQLQYWRTHLAGLEVAELPSRTGGRAGVMPGVGAHLDLDRDLLARLRAIGADARCSLFMVLLAAFYVVLARYTARTDLTVGVPVAGRPGRWLRALAGTFVNTLVLRTDVKDSSTFLDLLREVRRVALDAFAHQDLSFDRLVSELRPDRSVGRTPFFQVLFNVQNAPFDLPRIEGIVPTLMAFPSVATQFDLALSIDTEIGSRLNFTYDTGLFDRPFVEQLLRHYVGVLQSVAQNPRQATSEIVLFDEVDARELAAWNPGADPVPAGDNVLELFAQQVVARGTSPAVIDAEGVLTYAELEARASDLAGRLKALGVGPETIVGVFLDRSADAIVSLLGIFKAGGAYLPLDPAFPSERVTFMAEDSGVRLIVTTPALRDRLPSNVPTIGVDGSLPVAAGIARAAVDIHQLAYVIYTSGSTGQPKGVAIEHGALSNFLQSMQRAPGLTAADRLLSVTTISFDIAALEIFLPLITGATVVMASRTDVVDPAALAALLDRHRITVMQATPATWRMLLASGWTGRPTLKVLCGGEALTRELADQLLRANGEVWNMYGPTETTIWSTIERVEPGSSTISIGRPIANTSTFVVDEQLRPVPTGAIGELVIGGAGVARGYVNRPELTRDRFPNTGDDRGRVYRTGDMARRWPDGRIECLGRADRQVKIRGYRVELGEIEAAIEAAPGVAGAAVVAMPDKSGEARLVAFVVWAADEAGDAESNVRAAVARTLPAYMMPSLFVPVGRFPLTPNGKIHYAKLAIPEGLQIPAAEQAVPITDTERALAAIWSDVLSLPAVALDDDFFGIGGHSLLAVQVMARVEERFDKRLPLATLFEARTVRALARLLEAERAPSPWVSLIPMQPNGHRPPFFCVHAVGGEVLIYSALADHLPPTQPFVAIRAPFYDGRTELLGTIEEQAEYYVREVLAYQPTGPYYLGGYSHGGRVALEMAIRLQQRGRTVALLAIFDTPYLWAPQPRLRYGLRWLANLPKWVWLDLRLASPEEHRDRLQRASRLVGRILGFKGPHDAPGSSNVRDMMDIDMLPANVQAVYEQDYRAYVAYRPSARSGDVVVFRAVAQPLMSNHEPDLGWGRASQGTVTVRHIRGNHSSILQPPVVADLARALQEELDAAQASTIDATPDEESA